MKKNRILKRLFSIACVVCVIVLTFNMAYAKTNQYYNNSNGFDPGDENNGLLKTVFGWITGTILGTFGKCIAGLGFMFEMTIRGAIGLLTFDASNVQIYPWADRVIFNGMPLLDVNFINPEPGSLFMKADKSYTAIGNTVRSVYFTGMSIAIGFMGIVVAVMAIKLAISSIAAEKAKYKEAVTHWLMALILIFGLHYIIAFVFYLNEQLVEVASNMVNGILEDRLDEINAIDNFNLGTIGYAGGNVVSKLISPVEGMGDYFRSEAIKIEWPKTSSFISAIVYCVFLVQSLMFFIAYLKRFFYVAILACISPFVAIYDFLQKAVS